MFVWPPSRELREILDDARRVGVEDVWPVGVIRNAVSHDVVMSVSG